MPVVSKTLAPKKGLLPDGMNQRDMLREVVDFLRATMGDADAPYTARVAAARELGSMLKEHDTSTLNVNQLTLVQSTLEALKPDALPLKGELPDGENSLPYEE